MEIKNRKSYRFNSTVETPWYALSDFYRTAIDSNQARRLVDGLPDRRGSVAGELHLFTAEQEEEAVNILGGLPLDAADKNWNISIVPERLWAALRDIQKDVDTLLGRTTE